MAQFQVTADARVSEFEDSFEDERQIRGAIFSEPLSKVPRRPMVTVPVTATVGQAITAMNNSLGGCALVVRDGRLCGIFTERDVLQRVLGKAIPLEAPVALAMTPDPVTLPDSASIAYALHHMSGEGYRHVPLVDGEGQPIGVVAVRDIVGWICELFPASVLNLPPTPQVAPTADGA
jgi:CBS domain-containing protein